MKTIHVEAPSGVVHLSEQNGTYLGHPLFERTACGRTIPATYTWHEVSGAATCKGCVAKELDRSAPATAMEEPHACDDCGTVYDEASGDGYCGLCPSCADKSDDCGFCGLCPSCQAEDDDGA